ENNVHKQKHGFANFAIAQNYLRQRDLDNTEKYLVNALQIFEEVGDLKNQGTAYLLMSNLYVQNRAYDKAEKVLKKSIEISNLGKQCTQTKTWFCQFCNCSKLFETKRLR